MIDAPLGQYHIAARPDAGGMGEFYPATDTKLDREVAIKVLPPSLHPLAERGIADAAGDDDRREKATRQPSRRR